jgi:hypothetical protein
MMYFIQTFLGDVLSLFLFFFNEKEIGKQPFQIQKKGSHQVAKYFSVFRVVFRCLVCW